MDTALKYGLLLLQQLPPLEDSLNMAYGTLETLREEKMCVRLTELTFAELEGKCVGLVVCMLMIAIYRSRCHSSIDMTHVVCIVLNRQKM